MSDNAQNEPRGTDRVLAPRVRQRCFASTRGVHEEHARGCCFDMSTSRDDDGNYLPLVNDRVECEMKRVM